MNTYYDQTSLDLRHIKIKAQKNYIDHTENSGLMPYIPKRPYSKAYFYNDFGPEPSHELGNRMTGTIYSQDCKITSKRKNHATHRRQFQTAALVIVFAIFAFSAGGYMMNSEVSGYKEPEYKTVRVVQGDTLWAIAREYSPDNMDLRVYLGRICNINGIEPQDLQAGMTLRVPFYEE